MRLDVLHYVYDVMYSDVILTVIVQTYELYWKSILLKLKAITFTLNVVLVNLMLMSLTVKVWYSENGSNFFFCNEELRDLYSLPNIVRVVKSRRMKWAGHVTRMGEGRGVHRVLVWKPEGKRPLGRPRRRWEYNIKMDLQEVGGGWKLDGVGLG